MILSYLIFITELRDRNPRSEVEISLHACGSRWMAEVLFNSVISGMF
jgi:hypothetical protein